MIPHVPGPALSPVFTGLCRILSRRKGLVKPTVRVMRPDRADSARRNLTPVSPRATKGPVGIFIQLHRWWALAAAAPLIAIAVAAGAEEAGSAGGTGHLVPRGGIIAIVGVPGFEIERIFVHAGQKVKQGDPLFEENCVQAQEAAALGALELKSVEKDSEYRKKIQAAKLNLAQTKLLGAKRELANYRSVGASGTSELKLTQLQQAFAEADLNVKIQQLESQQQDFDSQNQFRNSSERAQMASANLERCTPRAPADGTILAIDHRVGEYAAGDPIMRFGDLSAVYVDSQFYQGDMQKIKVGMRLEIKNSVFSHRLDGTVVEVGSLIGTESQLGSVKIRLDRADPADRYIGMEVEVSIPQ